MLLYAYIKQRLETLFTTSNLSNLTNVSFFARNAIHVLCFTLLVLISSTLHSQEKNISSNQNTIEYENLLNTGNSFYKDKRYNAALEQYTQSLKYLSRDDKKTLKHLGIIYTKIAQTYKRLKNRKKTSHFYKKSLDAFTLIDNKKYMARTLNTLAEAERYLNNLAVALDYSTQSLELHKTINDPKGYAKALTGAGIIYRHIGRYEKSLIHIRQAYEYYKKINDYSAIAKTANEIANIYIHLEQFDQARLFFEETIKLPEEKLALRTLASASREMTVIEYKNKHYQSAMFYAKKAYKLYKKMDNKLKESLTARMIANIYRVQKNDINAIDYYKRSMVIAIEIGNETYQIEAQIPLASMLITKDTTKAVNLLRSSLEIAIKIKNEKQTLISYHKLSKAEEYRGNFKKALDYAKKEIILARVIQNKAEDKKLTLAKAALYSHKIEIELESLREKTKLDRLELIKKNNEIEIGDQARTINELKLIKNKYASIALVFLLVICLFLIGFVYRRFIASKKQNKQLNYLASRDSLTNCYNRRSLFEFMKEYLASTKLDDQYCIIMVDIDHFKKVNDTYGHNTGDSVIRGFASVLQSIVTQDDIVARFGGEEFCIVLHQASYQKAMFVAESIRNKIENSVFDNVTVTSSFGITSLQFGAQTPRELIEHADLALYKSKSLGRNRVTLWNKSFNKNPI